MSVAERLLQIAQPDAAGRETLDRLNLMTVGLDGQHDARPHRLSVEEDRARAADAMLAADVRAGQLEILAQKIAQEQPWLDVGFAVAAVDEDSDDHDARARRIVTERASRL
jgi:hypothetical protein